MLTTVVLATVMQVSQATQPAGRAVTQPTSPFGTMFAIPNGTLFVPHGFHPDSGAIDILIHFHGDPTTVARNFTTAGLDGVAVMVNYKGLSNAYAQPFRDRSLFASILRQSLAKLKEERRAPANAAWRRVCVGSFSAGYGAVRELLKDPEYFDRIDAIYLGDSLYAGYIGNPADKQVDSANMTDFRRFAEAAAAGRKTFIFSHTYLVPGTYASTFETADDLVRHVDGRREPIQASPSDKPPRIISRCSKGNLRVYGCAGTDAEAHMEHLRFTARFLAELPMKRAGTTQPKAE